MTSTLAARLRHPATFPMALMFGMCALIVLVATVRIPVLDQVANLGRVPKSASMSAEKWFGPAVDQVVDHVGRDGRIVEVSVYDDRIAVEADEGGRVAAWAFDWQSPRHMAVVPMPRIPTQATFSARLLDRHAPERLMAVVERRVGAPVSISVLRLEPPLAGGAPRWTLNGMSAAGYVHYTAAPDGTDVREGLG